MAVPVKQSIPINFAKGLDQKTDPFQVGAENFLALENMVFTKAGLLQKRNGFPQLSNSVANSPFAYTFKQIPVNITAGNTTASYNNELVLDDGMSLYSYSPGDLNWVYKGRAETCRISSTSIFQNQNNNLAQDSAINNTLGLAVYAWESWTNQPNLGGVINSVQLTVVDTTTGLNVLSASLSSTTSRPKCVSIAGFLYVLYFDSNDNKLHAQPITQAGLGTAAAIITGIDTTNTNYDALVFNSGLYIAYNGAGTTVNIALFSSTLVLSGFIAKSESASNGIGIFSDTSNNAWVAYNNGSATKAFIADSTLTTTVLAPTTIDSSGAASGVHNVTGIFDGTRGIIFYDKPGSLALAQQTTFTTGASFVQPAVGSTVDITISAVGFTEVGAVIFIPGGGYYYCVAQVVGAAAIRILNLGLPGNAAPGATVGATNQIIYPTNGYLNAIITFNTLTTAGVVGTPATFLRSCGLGSRAFLQNGFAHVIAAHDATIQPTYFVCSLYNVIAPVVDAYVLGKISASEAGGLPYRSLLPSVNVASTGVYQCALLQRTFLVENTSSGVSHSFWFTGIISGVIDTTVLNLSKVTLGQNLHLGSGTLVMYDGNSVVEHNFHLFPENVTFTNGGSGSLTAGIYSYIVVYSWIDNKGQIHRSAPSLQVTATCSANTQNTILIPTLRVTEKTAVTIELYRTIVNGSIFFRIDTLFLSGNGGYYPINNSTNSDTITIVEGRVDSDITGNQQLYTTGEVENIAVPPVLAMFEYGNRIILIPSDNPYSYWFSKQVDPGSPVEFSDVFVKNVGTIGGALTGGLRMDDKIVLGKQTSLYYVTGQGPASSGANDDFSDPVFITSDAGVANYQSLVFSPIGLFFKSLKGIYLLGRDLSVSYIGAPVENFNSQNILAAQLIPTTNQLRFILSGGSSLMYDYFFGQWGQFSNPVGVSDCIYNQLHTYVNSSGLVFQESPGTYIDGTATPVLMNFTTSWFKLAGLQGYQRAFFYFLLGQYISPHQLSVSTYTNFSATPDQTNVITPDSTKFLENWRGFFKNQRCQSFQVSLQEVYTGTPGAGFTMSGLLLIAGMKSRFRTIPAAQSVG